MAGFNAQKHWWIVFVAVAVVGVAALLITEQWLPWPASDAEQLLLNRRHTFQSNLHHVFPTYLKYSCVLDTPVLLSKLPVPIAPD